MLIHYYTWATDELRIDMTSVKQTKELAKGWKRMLDVAVEAVYPAVKDRKNVSPLFCDFGGLTRSLRLRRAHPESATSAGSCRWHLSVTGD
jgi:hypothetical protein